MQTPLLNQGTGPITRMPRPLVYLVLNRIVATSAQLVNYVSSQPDDRCIIPGLERVTADSGPNGSEDWLNCGINDGGWRPPNVKVDDRMYTCTPFVRYTHAHKPHIVITENLGEAIKTSNSPFKACEPYVQFFDKYGQENDGEYGSS
jgi:hypothetical protein